MNFIILPSQNDYHQCTLFSHQEQYTTYYSESQIYSNWFKGSPLSLTEGSAALQQCQLTANVEMPLRGEVSVGDQRVAGGTPQHPAQVVHAGGEVEDALRHVPVH